MPNEVEPPIGIGAALIMVFQPELEMLRQQFAKDNPKWIITPDTAAVLAIRQQRDYGDMAELASRSGFNEDQFGLMVDALKQYLTADDVMTAFYRGHVDDGTKDMLLAILGYAERERDLISKVSEVIPNVQDVVRFLTRDVFIPEFVQTFGMDLEFPEDAYAHFGRLGMSKESALNFWRAHWELPGLSQGYEMYQRGKIDETALRRLMRAQGVEPYWRDPLIAIAYNPLTRVDIRRVHKLLKKDRTWLIEQYKNTGYNDDNANTLADFTIEYNKEDKKAALKDLTDGLRTSIVNGVVSGYVPEGEATTYLSDMGYSGAEIQAYFSYARTLRAEKTRARITELTGDLYIKSHATKEEVTAYLDRNGMSGEEISLRFEEWDIEKELKGPTDKAQADRDLTKAEIISSYKDGLSTKAEAKADIVKMRYDENEAERLLALADYELAKQVQKEEIETVKNQVLRGLMDETEAGTKLDSLRVRPTQKSALISSWFRQVEAKVFDVPLSMVQDMRQREIITDDEAREYLHRIGAKQVDAERIMELWGAKATEKAQRTSTTTTKK